MMKRFCDMCEKEITARDMVYSIRVATQGNGWSQEQWAFEELCEQCYVAMTAEVQRRKPGHTAEREQTQILSGMTSGTLTAHHCLVDHRWVMTVAVSQYVNDTPRLQRLRLPGCWVALPILYNSSGLMALCDEGDLVIISPQSLDEFNGLIVLGEERVGDVMETGAK